MNQQETKRPDHSLDCEDSTEAESWLRKTAWEGHVQAMYEYAMHCDNVNERRWWLIRAANQGLEVATDALDSLDRTRSGAADLMIEAATSTPGLLPVELGLL